jgi:ectoine hydroxylase-related dioxygenase (phytanoyl-CoA dioxygenase family)
MPGDPKHVPWHQDASYWPMTPARTVTVWLAIDDADPENAAMQFVPATHRLGPLEWRNTDKPAVLGQEIVNIGQFGKPVSDDLRAGEMSLHADMLAHGSSPNTSARRRCGLTIRYCSPQVVSLDPSWMTMSVICRGHDPTGRWANVARPEGEDLSRDGRPKSIGAN